MEGGDGMTNLGAPRIKGFVGDTKSNEVGAELRLRGMFSDLKYDSFTGKCRLMGLRCTACGVEV